MIPVLFTSTATEFTTQGLGALTDAISCTATEERNGIFELEMQYPVTGIHYADIQYRSIIVAIPSPYRSKQPFRVYKITRPLDGVVTIYAAHLSYDLNAIPAKPFSATGIVNAFAALKENMLISNNFTFQAGITNTSSKISYQTPNAARSVLGGIQGSFLDIFGGEYEWDGWIVRLWANRGADNGVNIRYGKNMTALNAETDGENTVTGIYPYWYKDDVLVDADIVWAENAPYQKALPVDFTNDFEEQPTEAQLTERAEQYISDNDVGTVPVSIDVSFIQLAQMSGYENIAALEKCDLCDTVTVQYEALGVDVKSKIVKIVTDVLRERYESMQVGTIRADVAQTIADTENKVDAVVRPDGSLVAEALRGFINGSLVNLYAQYNEAEPAGAMAILFENNDPSSDLYGALAIGTQGLMISREKKSDGTGWNWTTALTSEGLMAGIIAAGILTDKSGNNYWNLDTGQLVSTKGTIGGWNIGPEALTSPSGNMEIDADAAMIRTIRQNGNQGVVFQDDGITFCSWADDGNYIGRIGSGIYADENRHVLNLIADSGDALILGCENGNELLYIAISNVASSQGRWDTGVTLGSQVRALGSIYFGSVGSTTRIYSTQQNQMIVEASGGLYLPANSRLGGYGIVRSNVNNQIHFEWTGSQLNLYIDNTYIGRVVTQ